MGDSALIYDLEQLVYEYAFDTNLVCQLGDAINIKQIALYSSDIDWFKVSLNSPLSIPFAKQFIDFIEWPIVCATRKLSEEFIEAMANVVDWILIIHWQEVSIEFVKRNNRYINWKAVSNFPGLTEEQMSKFADLLDWQQLSHEQEMSRSFINKYICKIDLGICV